MGGTTRKELQAVQADYKAQIEAEVIPSIEWISGNCLYLGQEMCYNHHERGQRLWAFVQALKEAGVYGTEE